MLKDKRDEPVPFDKVQGLTSTNIPAYSNRYNDFISFEIFSVHGIFTGFKWQCVEFARRWLLLSKSCTFKSIEAAADMWDQQPSYVERVTDGKKFHMKACPNGSPEKPKCDAFLIYFRTPSEPYGHIAVICEVQDTFIHVIEQNYRFEYWPSNYARQVPLVYRNGLYYIEDYLRVYGWLEIENIDQLKPLDELNIDSVLEIYRQPKLTGELKYFFVSRKIEDEDAKPVNDDEKENLLSKLIENKFEYYITNADFFISIGTASNRLYRLLMKFISSLVDNDEILNRLEIPSQFWSRIRKSWLDDCNFNLLDCMVFKSDGNNLKLFQYKIDHALQVFNSAMVQERTVQAMNLKYDCTSTFQLHGLFVRYWKRLNITTTIHILIDNEQDDLETISYMKKVMEEADIKTKLCQYPHELCWRDSTTIVDKDGDIVHMVWKSWNWEKIFQDFKDKYDRYQVENISNRVNNEHPCLYDILLDENIRIIEPLWKCITNHRQFLSFLCDNVTNDSETLQNGCFSLEDLEYLTFIKWTKHSDNNGIIQFQDPNMIFRINNSKRNDIEHHEISEEENPRKDSSKYEETIISWMIDGLCSGFSIGEDLHCDTDSNNTKIYSCLLCGE